MIVAIISKPQHLKWDRDGLHGVKVVAAGRYISVGTDHELLHADGSRTAACQADIDPLMAQVDRVDVGAEETAHWLRSKAESAPPQYLGCFQKQERWK